jgi:hypothetical protein
MQSKNELTKECTKCHKIVEIRDYPKCKSFKSGIKPFCKKCYSTIRKEYREKNKDKIKFDQKKWREKNKEKISKKNKEWREKNKDILKIKKEIYVENNHDKVKNSQKRSRIKARLEALKAYGGENPKCNCCQESEIKFLCIDHINGGGVKHRKKINRLAGTSFYVWLKNNGYPSGFRVLCMNCNSSIGSYKYCPHYENRKFINENLSKTAKYLRKFKLKALKAYGGENPSCVCCGIHYTEFLCIDHINEDGNKHRKKIRSHSLYKWLEDNEYPSGFRILCWSCNFVHWAHKICTHSKI